MKKTRKMETIFIDDTDIVIRFWCVAHQLEGTLDIKRKDTIIS